MKLRYPPAYWANKPRELAIREELRAIAISDDPQKGFTVETDSDAFKAVMDKLPKPKSIQKPQEEWGPCMWRQIHRWALVQCLVHDSCKQDAAGWLMEFVKIIPCGDCRWHFEALLMEFPPDFSDNAALFYWTWWAHDKVSQRLGKPQITHNAAEVMYRDLLASR